MTEPRDARVANSAPAPSAEVQHLGALVGRWRTEGRIIGGPAVPIADTGLRVACRRLLPAAKALEWSSSTLIQGRSKEWAGTLDAETKRPGWTP
jgi:hypothetical protein